MNRWVPVAAFIAAAAIVGIPVGWGVGAGWLCDRPPPPACP